MLKPRSTVANKRHASSDAAAPAMRPLYAALLRAESIWLAALILSICVEGMVRKYVPSIPPSLLYVAKDVVLLSGLAFGGIHRDVRKAASKLYGIAVLPLAFAVLWTILEVANPDQQSLSLAALGLRSYWLWWLAPFIIASVLRRMSNDVRPPIVLLASMAIIVALIAVSQFAAPADADINRYAWTEDPNVNSIATVASTGRVRVSATFSFLSGFTAFVTLVGPLLLAVGLGAPPGIARWMSLAAGLSLMAVGPMSGSRAVIVFSAAGVGLVALGAGVLKTRAGRRIAIGAIFGVVAMFFAFPEAVAGVQSRFDNTTETNSRLQTAFEVFPPVAIASYEYPMLGIGTGMQQNARFAIKLATKYSAEPEPGRHLIELGPIGYLLFWFARFGIVIALLRAALKLRTTAGRGTAGLAAWLAVATMIGSITFDHIWQSLYFFAVGFVLAEVTKVSATPTRAAMMSRAPTALRRRPPASNATGRPEDMLGIARP